MGEIPVKVLLIDDAEEILIGLKALLQRGGYDVLTSNNGTDGLSLALSERPDVIVCDVMMPPPDGFELRKIISASPDVADIPFIFLTARASQMDRLIGLDTGADDYMTKPFDVRELIARIESILKRQELGRKTGLKESQLQMEKLRKMITQNVSHELRTPITVMITALELALREKTGTDQASVDEFIQTALANAQRLRDLTDDLLLLYEIDQDKINTFRTPINLEYDFSIVVRETLEKWQEKNLTPEIMMGESMVINAPRAGFKRMVAHLVDNACKFSPVGGIIKIDLQKNGIGGCLLEVADQGPGIPGDQKERIFERYYQVSQGDNRKYSGIGVGLYISRAIARALGGNVEVIDSPSGCEMRMILPEGEADWKAGGD
jgi:signal transduction histidine kinase